MFLLKLGLFDFNFQNSLEKRIFQLVTPTVAHFKWNFVQILELVLTSFILEFTRIDVPASCMTQIHHIFKAEEYYLLYLNGNQKSNENKLELFNITYMLWDEVSGITI